MTLFRRSPPDISTVDKPFTNDVGFNAPDFKISVGGSFVPAGIRQLAEKVEYESSDGMADVMKVTFRDPLYIPPKGLIAKGPLRGLGPGGGGSGSALSLRDLKVFQPGNEMALWLGYGTALKCIGRVVIRKVRPNYPRDEMPSVVVIGYTKDSAMMDNSPQKPKNPPQKKKRKKGAEKVPPAGTRVFKQTTFADAVRTRALEYNFELDVDDSMDAPSDFTQKIGLSDYDFVKGLSNLTGYFFWVDARDPDGAYDPLQWWLHFKNPDTLRRKIVQDKYYTFKYDQGATSSLLEFEPELVLQGATTRLQAQVVDPASGKKFEAVFDEDNEETPDPLAVAFDDVELDVAGNVMTGEYKSAASVRIFLDDFSFFANTNRRFRSEAELIQWARQWFRRHRENFVLSHGTIIGIETVMARQHHKISGVGMGLDGDYYFTNVRHVMQNGSGYELDCTMRKSVPEMA
jgi:phage protein D